MKAVRILDLLPSACATPCFACMFSCLASPLARAAYRVELNAPAPLKDFSDGIEQLLKLREQRRIEQPKTANAQDQSGDDRAIQTLARFFFAVPVPQSAPAASRRQLSPAATVTIAVPCAYPRSHCTWSNVQMVARPISSRSIARARASIAAVSASLFFSPAASPLSLPAR